MNNTSGAYVVSWDFTHGKDKGVLLVGSNKSGKMEVVNAFQNDEAYELYMKLTGEKKGE